jgi:hypothetical protein
VWVCVGGGVERKRARERARERARARVRVRERARERESESESEREMTRVGGIKKEIMQATLRVQGLGFGTSNVRGCRTMFIKGLGVMSS